MNFYVYHVSVIYVVPTNVKVVDQPSTRSLYSQHNIMLFIYNINNKHIKYYIIIFCSFLQPKYINTIQVLLIGHHTLQIKRTIGFEINLNNDWVIRLQRFIGTMLLIYV